MFSSNKIVTYSVNGKKKYVATDDLLSLVMNGKREKIAVLLRALSSDPDYWKIILERKSGVEPCGRKWDQISPLEFATWAGKMNGATKYDKDKYQGILNLFLKHLNSNETSLEETVSQMKKMRANGSPEHGPINAPFDHIKQLADAFDSTCRETVLPDLVAKLEYIKNALKLLPAGWQDELTYSSAFLYLRPELESIDDIILHLAHLPDINPNDFSRGIRLFNVIKDISDVKSFALELIDSTIMQIEERLNEIKNLSRSECGLK